MHWDRHPIEKKTHPKFQTPEKLKYAWIIPLNFSHLPCHLKVGDDFFLNERLVMMIDDPGLLFQHFCQLLPCMFIVGGPGSASACRLRTYSLFMDRPHASA